MHIIRTLLTDCRDSSQTFTDALSSKHTEVLRTNGCKPSRKVSIEALLHAVSNNIAVQGRNPGVVMAATALYVFTPIRNSGITTSPTPLPYAGLNFLELAEVSSKLIILSTSTVDILSMWSKTSTGS
jgi:hypothetical protein